MCNECNDDIFPKQLDTDQPKNKSTCGNKLNRKQCLTCDNVVPNKIYPNKHVVYNDRKHHLCEKCSNLGTNIPVKDTTMIEFQDCAICSKQVKYEEIFCNLCQHLVHPYCNGINRKELKN